MKIRKITAGVTLVEVLIAVAIIVFAVAGIMDFYLAVLTLSGINNEEAVANTHSINMMEAIRCTPFNNIIINFPNGVNDGTGSNNYSTIVGGYPLANEHIVVSYVNPGSDPLEINVSVNWQDKRGTARTRNLVTKMIR
ncbi:MAG: hypothetical protein WBI28_05360 [Candidatus Omnitrophota bacterium]